MSLGATASAPASACETAVRASSSSVWSLSTTPSARSTPQWPCDVYSHRHRSVMTSRSGCAALIARVASWITPSSSHAPEPSASLLAGSPNSSTAGMPSACGDPGLLDRAVDREVVDPRQLGDRRALRAGRHHEHRVDEVRDRRARSRGRGRAARRSGAGGAGGWRGRPSRAKLRTGGEPARATAAYASARAPSRCDAARATSPSSARSVGLNGNAPETTLSAS